MRKLYFILALLIAPKCFSQLTKKFSTFLSFQANKTFYDRTITNNTAGFGLGLQTLVNTGTFINPLLEINADFFAGTKELYVSPNGKPIKAKDGVLGIYVGPMLRLTENLFATTTFGTSIYNNTLHFGVRPSVCFYPSKSKRWAAKTAFTNIFQQDVFSSESFGYLSFALALELF